MKNYISLQYRFGDDKRIDIDINLDDKDTWADLLEEFHRFLTVCEFSISKKVFIQEFGDILDEMEEIVDEVK